MSISYNAVLVVGVRYDEVVTTRTDTKEVTKYNPDTGAPYQHTISEEIGLVCGVPQDDPDDYLERTLKLEVVVPGYDGEREDAVVGVTVVEVDQEVSIADVSLARLDKVKIAVDRTLRHHGYTGPAPKTYVLLQAG